MFARSHSAHGTGYYSLYVALTVRESTILHFPNILQRLRIAALHSRFSTTRTVGKFEGKPHYRPRLHSGKSVNCPVDTYGGARAVERYAPGLFTSAVEQVGFSGLEEGSRSTCFESLPAMHGISPLRTFLASKSSSLLRLSAIGTTFVTT